MKIHNGVGGPSHETTTLAWTASTLSVLGLAAAAAGSSKRLLDLATVMGIVLVTGVAGAG